MVDVKKKKRQERGTVRMIRMLGERLSAVGEEPAPGERSTQDLLRDVLDGFMSRDPRAREREERQEALATSSMSKGTIRRAM
jgi:hypothetical protein